MNKKITISIVIPTFNEEKTIETCLKSILSQNFKGKLEIFIVDAGSTDNTLIKAKKYPVNILQNPQKHAEIGKMIGFRHSKGDYFMILDCDMTLIGTHWFDNMLQPLVEQESIIGSFAKFVSLYKDKPLDRYITLDPIQRDPLFQYLTPSLQSLTISKTPEYHVLRYGDSSMIPAGFCLYRMKDIKQNIEHYSKYMELDIIARFVTNGKCDFAYVQKIGIHHPFLGTLSQLAKKRERNLNTMYFNQPEERNWTWVDWNTLFGKLKIVVWILWVYSLVPSIIIGIIKTIRYSTWVGLYELPFNLIMTSIVIKAFLQAKQGRSLLYK
jgi:glycosyltransferase involved in cell wall biosynthesis